MAIHKKKPLFPFNTISEALQWWRNSDDSDSSVLTQYKTIHNHIHFNRLNCQNKILLTIFDWQFFRINFRCGNKNWARSSFEFIWVEIFRQAIILCLKIPWMNNWIESERVSTYACPAIFRCVFLREIAIGCNRIHIILIFGYNVYSVQISVNTVYVCSVQCAFASYWQRFKIRSIAVAYIHTLTTTHHQVAYTNSFRNLLHSGIVCNRNWGKKDLL